MPAVDAKQYNLSHFDNSDIWFKASYDLNVKTGWLGRWIDAQRLGRPTRCRRSRSTPRCRSRSARRPTRCARSRRCRSLGFTMNSARRRRRERLNVNAADARRWPALSAGAGQRLPRAHRARPTALAVETLPAQSLPPGRPTPPAPATRTRRRCRPGCGSPRTCWRRTSARASSRSTGAASTPTAASSPSQDRQLTELSRALAAFRADLQARGDRAARRARWSSPSSAAASRENGSAGHRPRRRRPDDGDGQRRPRRPRRPTGPAASRRTSCPPTTRRRAT